MLTHIIILFQKKYEPWIEQEHAAQMRSFRDNYKDKGILVDWFYTEAFGTSGRMGERALPGQTGKAPDREDTLYVTDDPVCFGILQQEGTYVIGLYHAWNRDSSFPDCRYAMDTSEGMADWDEHWFFQVYNRLAGLPCQILETERLLVRESTLEDVDEFYRIYADPSITRYMEPLYEDPDKEREFMKDYIQKIYGYYGYGIWTVLKKDSGRVIGRAGLVERDGFSLPELGFIIEEKEQRKGYAREVCTAILDYGAEQLGFEAVQALVREKNLVSRHLLEELGFTDRGEVQAENKSYLQYVISLKNNA